MDIPDFTGVEIDTVLSIMRERYPEVKYELIEYYAPQNTKNIPDKTCNRVIKQRFKSNSDIVQLIISSFLYNI